MNFTTVAAQHGVNVNPEHCKGSRNGPESAQAAPCPQPCSPAALRLGAGQPPSLQAAAVLPAVLPHQEGRAERWEKQMHFHQDFVSYKFDSILSTPSQTRRHGVVQIRYHLVLLIHNSTARDKQLKVLSSIQTEESLQRGAWGLVTAVSSSPPCTHSTQHWAACNTAKSQPPALSTDHKRQNHSETSLLQIAVISHLSSARLTSLGPQGTIYSIRFGLRVPKLWLRRQNKWFAAVPQRHTAWRCHPAVAVPVVLNQPEPPSTAPSIQESVTELRWFAGREKQDLFYDLCLTRTFTVRVSERSKFVGWTKKQSIF